MNIKDLLNSHELHDSFIDALSISEDQKNVDIELTYLFWMQSNYNDDDKEFGKVILKLNNVSSFDYDEHEIDSESIIEAVEIEEDVLCFKTVNEVTGNYYEYKFYCDDVEFVEINE